MADYDSDILEWSERQSALLRRRAAGDLVNEAELDWPNIAEEIEDVGRSEQHRVESLLVQALRNMLKAEAWPLSRDAPTWRADAIDFRQQAGRRFVSSMRPKIDVAGLYADARRALPETIDGLPPLPIKSEIATLDALLANSETRSLDLSVGSKGPTSGLVILRILADSIERTCDGTIG